jgi:predicted membrane protein
MTPEVKQEIILKLQRLIKDGAYSFKLKEALNKSGISEELHDDLIAEARKINQMENGKLRKKLWLAFGIVTILLFTFLIPLQVYLILPNLLSGLGAFLIIIFTIQFLFDFRSQKEIDYKLKGFRRTVLVSLSLLLCFILLFLFFKFYFQFRLNSELDENGISVKGVVTEKYTTRVKRSYQYNIKIRYVDNKNVSRTRSFDVSEDEFNSVFEGDSLFVQYSSKNPAIVDLILNKEAVNRISNSENRKIEFEDFEILLKLEYNKLRKEMKSIHSYWNENKSDSSWYNSKTNEEFKRMNDFTLVLLNYSLDIFPEMNNYRIISDDSLGIVYENEEYLIELKKFLNNSKLGKRYVIYSKKNLLLKNSIEVNRN